jgi:hypothetical protein
MNIYKQLNLALTQEDQTPVYFLMGKIFRIIIDFQPIELMGYTPPIL